VKIHDVVFVGSEGLGMGVLFFSEVQSRSHDSVANVVEKQVERNGQGKVKHGLVLRERGKISFSAVT
jgi:hypothetical protein